MPITKILCVCLGNSDRSPVMAGVLSMLLRNAGSTVLVESAGVSESALDGGAGAMATITARKIGIDLSDHKRRRTTSLKLNEYYIIVCVNDQVAGELINQGAKVEKIYNAQITNPWPVNFIEDYEPTMTQIMGGMYKVVARYF